MKKEEFIATIDQFQRGCDANNKEIEMTRNIITVDWICNVTGRHNTLVLSLISRLTGISEDFLDWFCFENDFGRKGLICSEKDGPEIPIKTASDLWDFVKR